MKKVLLASLLCAVALPAFAQSGSSVIIEPGPQTGTGNWVRAASPTGTGTWVLPIVQATTLAIGGATIGANGLAVTGNSLLTGHLSFTADSTYDVGTSGARPRDLTISRTITLGSTSPVVFGSRSTIKSPADGQVSFTDAASTAGTIWAVTLAASNTPSFSGSLTLAGIASDATHTDATVCVDTTSKTLYSGSGAVGICLGTSSLRYKTDVKAMTSEMARELLTLRAVTFHYKAPYGDTKKEQPGFIAEEVVKVAPKLVGLDAEGRPNSVDWAAIVPRLVMLSQEQEARIKKLELANAILVKRVTQLELAH